MSLTPLFIWKILNFALDVTIGLFCGGTQSNGCMLAACFWAHKVDILNWENNFSRLYLSCLQPIYELSEAFKEMPYTNCNCYFLYKSFGY